MSVRQIRAESKRTQLCLQIELAEEKAQSLQSQKPSRLAQQMYVTKKNRFSKRYEKVLCAGPKHFDKLKPEPGPKSGSNRKARPDLQLCFTALL